MKVKAIREVEKFYGVFGFDGMGWHLLHKLIGDIKEGENRYWYGVCGPDYCLCIYPNHQKAYRELKLVKKEPHHPAMKKFAVMPLLVSFDEPKKKRAGVT